MRRLDRTTAILAGALLVLLAIGPVLPKWAVFLVTVALAKALVVLVMVALVDVVNPRLRIDQAMGYYLRVAFSSAAALAFAVIGM